MRNIKNNQMPKVYDIAWSNALSNFMKLRIQIKHFKVKVIIITTELFKVYERAELLEETNNFLKTDVQVKFYYLYLYIC